MAPLWPLTFSSGERPRALWALLLIARTDKHERRWLIEPLCINNLNNNIFNHKQCHVFYCGQLPCSEFLNWNILLRVMAQSQIICDASAMGKPRVIRTKSWDRSHNFATVGCTLRTPVACRKWFRHRHTRRVPNPWYINCTIARKIFLPILGIPDTISDDLRCPPINRRGPPNYLRQVARFCVGLHIQVEIQCLRVVSGDLRLNRRRPATTRRFSVIISDESYGGIVVNRRVYK